MRLVVLAEDLHRLAGCVAMHNDVDVEDSVRLQVLDLVGHDWSVGQGQASHRVSFQFTLKSLRALLVHDHSLCTKLLNDLRVKVRSVQLLLPQVAVSGEGRLGVIVGLHYRVDHVIWVRWATCHLGITSDLAG